VTGSDRESWRRRLRGFGPLGLLAIVVILLGNSLFIPFSAILVLLWAHVSGTPWRNLGFVPKLMIAHAAFDVTAVALIYWRLETAVAHWFFS
jgi:hypothetical protein